MNAGEEILDLLCSAWNRKLIFTVGRSATTGFDNSTIWNGIPHKTKLSGGAVEHGYPDVGYFGRVRSALALFGISS